MEFSFSDNQSVETIEKVPEDFRGLYIETDGKFRLNSEDGGVKSAVAAITRMDVALKASRAETKAARTGRIDLSPLSEFGDNPAGILETFNGKISEIEAHAKANGNEDIQRQVEKIKQDLAKAHSGDLEKRDARIGALTGQLHNILVKGEAVSALAGANALDPDLALPFLEKQVKVTEEDGKFLVAVVDTAGDIRYSGVTGAPMSIKELVAEMKANEKFAPLFKSEAPYGGGKPPGGQPQRQLPNSQGGKGEMSSQDKISLGLRKGQHVGGTGMRR